MPNMSDDPKDSVVPSTAEHAQSRVVVQPVGNGVVDADVALDDGTTLRLRVILNSVLKLDGVRDSAGRPVYDVEAVVFPIVKEWRR